MEAGQPVRDGADRAAAAAGDFGNGQFLNAVEADNERDAWVSSWRARFEAGEDVPGGADHIVWRRRIGA